MEPNQEKKSYGALIGSVVIIVILVLGGIYFWMSKQNTEISTPEENQGAQINDQDAAATSELNELEDELNLGASVDSSLDVSTVQ